MRNNRSSRTAGKHSGYGNPVTPAARTYTDPAGAVGEARYEDITTPIFTGQLPQPPESIVPPIYTGPLPEVPTGPQIQPPRPPQPTGPQIQPPRPPQPTGPQIQPPRPPQPTGPQIQPPRPPRPQPPRPTGPVRPQPTGSTRPPSNAIPPYGQLPRLNLNMRPDQSLGVGDCLAPSSVVYAPQLEQFIRQELGLYQSFMNWADRYPTKRNALRELAAESLERARILLRAYSFITDEYYWPTYMRPTVALTNYTREMRQLYNTITQLERSYLIAYRNTTDSCLATVYLNLADRATSQRQRMARTI